MHPSKDPACEGRPGSWLMCPVLEDGVGIGAGAARVLGAFQCQHVSMSLEKGTDSKRVHSAISVRDPAQGRSSSSLQQNSAGQSERAGHAPFISRCTLRKSAASGRVAQGTTCKAQRPGSPAAECDQGYKTRWDTSWLVLGKNNPSFGSPGSVPGVSASDRSPPPAQQRDISTTENL